MLKVLRKDYDDRDINNSLLAYADDFLVGNVKVNHILPYFLKEEKGDFPVFGRYLEIFNTEYSHT